MFPISYRRHGLVTVTVVGRLCGFARNWPKLGSWAAFSIYRLCARRGWRSSRGRLDPALERGAGHWGDTPDLNLGQPGQSHPGQHAGAAPLYCRSSGHFAALTAYLLLFASRFNLSERIYPRSRPQTFREHLALFTSAHCTNEPRPVPNLRARVVGLLVEHQRGEFAGFFVRGKIDIMPFCSKAVAPRKYNR
jgi:hypothetical protein